MLLRNADTRCHNPEDFNHTRDNLIYKQRLVSGYSTFFVLKEFFSSLSKTKYRATIINMYTKIFSFLFHATLTINGK